MRTTHGATTVPLARYAHPGTRPGPGDSGVATLDAVGSDREESAAPDALDRWIADVGEDHIAAMVELTRKGVADGTIIPLADKDAFLRHLASRVDEPT